MAWNRAIAIKNIFHNSVSFSRSRSSSLGCTPQPCTPTTLKKLLSGTGALHDAPDDEFEGAACARERMESVAVARVRFKRKDFIVASGRKEWNGSSRSVTNEDGERRERMYDHQMGLNERQG
jgi:hypothetical protein